jgi:Tol biopolymer transport system component
LTIEVRDTAGQPLAGARVTFEGLIGRRDIGDPIGASTFVEMTIAPLGASTPGDFFSVVRGTTDADGRLSVLLRLGPAAPQGRLAVEVGDPAAPMFRDTVTMTILPGAAAAVRMLSADTTFYVGRTLALSGVVVDRHENVRAGDTVHFETTPPLRVSGNGVVDATDYGLSYVVVSGASGRDSVQVAAVPQGRILAVSRGYVPELVIADMDGAHRLVVPPMEETFDAAPAWSRDGRHFAFSSFSLGRSSGGEIFVADSTASKRRLFPAGTFRNAAYPRYSSDGEWIYFSGQDENALFSLWRVHPDGTAAEKLGTDLGGTGVDWRSDPSPDGSRLLFSTLFPMSVDWGIRMFDLASGEVSSWIVPGNMARWSPDGERIALTWDGNAPIRVMNADGTGVRELSPAASSAGLYHGPVDWSPDGRWLVAASDAGRLELVEVDTGLRLPLFWSRVLEQPVWRSAGP